MQGESFGSPRLIPASVAKSAFYVVLSVNADTKYGETGKIAATSVAKSATGGILTVNASSKQRGPNASPFGELGGGPLRQRP